MTLTTEQLRERIGHLKERLHGMKQHKYPDDCPNAKAYLETLKAERQQDIALLEELLANREAQPVAYIGAQMLEDLTDGGRSCGRVWARSEDELSGDDRLALYTAPPAPAVPPEKQCPDVDEFDGDPYDDLYITECNQVDGWNACRAAMLAQPVSQGYMLPDSCKWTYDDQDYKWDSACGEAWMFSDGGPTENGVKFCQGCGKPVLLAAAPEGGNG